MHEFHHGLGHVQHGCKNEVVLPLSLADSAIYSCSGPCPVSIICRSKANLAVCCSACSCRSSPFAFGMRLWLVSIMSLCLWQARAPAVERPTCAFGCLCLPCLHVMSLCLWQARAPAVERPRCALGSCPSCPFAFGKPVRPLWNARGAPLAVCVCLVSMSCPFAFGKPVRPPWNARGAPLAVCLCSLPSCHAFASPS